MDWRTRRDHDAVRFRLLAAVLVSFPLAGGCSDLPDVGVVGRGTEAPLAVFRECDDADQRIGRLTVYRDDFDGPKIWSASVVDREKALPALPLGVSTVGYRTSGALPGRESSATFVFEAESVEGVNMDGATFRWRDLREGKVLLDDGDYRDWPEWRRW